MELGQKLSNRAPTFAHAVIDGILEGEYHQCHLSNSTLIGTKSGIYVVDGDVVDEALIKVIMEKWRAASLKQERFTLFAYEAHWQQAIENCLTNQFRKVERVSYQFDLERYKAREMCEGAQHEIKLFNRIHITKSDEFNEAYFKEYWGSVGHFLNEGIGYCIEAEGRLISEIISIFKSTKYAEIDIATAVEYRGKGLAYIIAEYFIDRCIANNIEPRWDCEVNNVASMRLAERLGFAKPIPYMVFARA